MTKKKVIWAGVAAVGMLAGAWLKPKEATVARDAYFDAVQAELIAQHIAHPVVIIDLDRVDANLAEIRRVLGREASFRATTKSLPSYELLEYIEDAMGQNRVMEFYGPFLRPLIERLGQKRPLDILLGKPLPASDLEAFLTTPPEKGQASVRWLIDTKERLDAYLEVARRRNVRLDIVFEIDVGLHRGGLETTAALLALVERAQGESAHLRVAGVMGYDGHVSHAPPLFRSQESAQRAAFSDAMHNLDVFIAALKARFPGLVTPDFVVNSGGSKTYSRYRNPDGSFVGPANELAMGSAVLQPLDFDSPALRAHQPALYIAEPVLKRISPGRLPFADSIGALWRFWNPNRHDAVFVYGGGWNLEPVYPRGLSANPLYNDRPADNRIPNQTLLNAGQHHTVQPGDFVFYRPLQSDALMQFDEIQVMRGGKRIAIWHPLPRRL